MSEVSLRLRKLKTAMTLTVRGQWRDLFWHARMELWGVDRASGNVKELELHRGYYHHATLGPELEKVLRQIDIPPGSKIIDIGCGKGIAITTMVKFPFARIAGCDLSPDLIRIAETNFARLGIKGVSLYCCEASQFTELDDYSHVYFFNPFPPEVFRPVMDNIVSSLIRKPRRLTIIYLNPTCHEVIVSAQMFDKVKECRYSRYPYYVYVNRNKGQ